MSRVNSRDALIPGELVERLEVADAGSEELSARVMQALTEPSGYVERSRFNGVWCVYRADGKLTERRGPWCRPEGWAVTESLDAALALAERVLPKEWTWRVEKNGEGYHGAFWSDPDYAPEGEAVCPTPSLALCAAILKATTASSVGTSAASEPVAWRYRQLHHEIDGPITGWAYTEIAPNFSASRHRYEAEPLYAAPVLPVEVREKIARAASDIIFLRKDHPGKTERFYAEEAVARAREVLSTITGDA